MPLKKLPDTRVHFTTATLLSRVHFTFYHSCPVEKRGYAGQVNRLRSQPSTANKVVNRKKEKKLSAGEERYAG
jgi:hypothetical protein